MNDLRLSRFVIGALTIWCCIGAAAPEEELRFVPPEPHPVTATLIAEHASVQPGGSTRVGVYFEIEDGWHIYAQDPGDAGLPTEVTWSVPDGASVGPLEWPAPQEFLDPGEIRTFGYDGAVVLRAPLTLTTSSHQVSTLPIEAEVKWVACREICLPGKATLELTLPVTSDPPVRSTHALLFE